MWAGSPEGLVEEPPGCKASLADARLRKTEEKQLLLPCSSTKKEKCDDRRNLTLLSLTSAPNKVMEK